MPKSTVFAFLLAAAVPTALSQSPKSAEILVDCVVLDQQGRPVEGLQADDFRVMEDDSPYTVRLEASGSGQSEEVYPVVLALVGKAAAGGEPEATAAALKALARQTAPGYQVAVFRMAEQLELLLPFSSSAEEWAAAVKRSWPGQLLDPQTVPQAAAPDKTALATPEGRLELSRQIQRIFSVSDPSLRQSPRSSHPALIQAVSRALSGIAGRKTLILLGSGLQSGELAPSEAGRTIDLANAFHLTVYSADEDPAEVLDAGAKRLAQETQKSPSPLMDMVHQSGGFILRPDRLADHLERAFYEARRHYRLYYRSNQPSLDGRTRELFVRLKDPRMESRQRSGYPARPDDVALLDRDELLLLGNIRQAAVESPLKATLSAAVLQRNDVLQEAVVSLGIPVSSLQIRDFSSDGREGRMCKVVASGLLRDSTGAVLRTFSGPLALTLNAAQFQILQRDGLALNQRLQLVPGSYTVEVALLDEIGGKAIWLERKVQVAVPGHEPRLSPIVLGRVDPAAQRGREALPLVGDGFVPAAASMFPAQGPLHFVCEIYNAGEDSKLEVQAYLQNASGARTDLKPELESKTPQLAVVKGDWNLADLSEGDFELVVEVNSATLPTHLEARTPLRIVQQP